MCKTMCPHNLYVHALHADIINYKTLDGFSPYSLFPIILPHSLPDTLHTPETKHSRRPDSPQIYSAISSTVYTHQKRYAALLISSVIFQETRYNGYRYHGSVWSLREGCRKSWLSLFGKSQAGSKFGAPSSTLGDHAKHSSSHHRGQSSHHHSSSSHHPNESSHHTHHSSRPSHGQRTVTSHARPSMAMMPFDGPMESRRPSMSGPRRTHSHFPSSTHSHLPSTSLRPSAYGPSNALSRYPSQVAASRGPARTVEYEIEYSMKVKYSER
jgi:hypothetical protein